LGYETYIRLQPKRFRCDYCDDRPSTTQRLSWYNPNTGVTKAYERYLLRQLVNSTITDVSHKAGIGYDVVRNVLERRVQQQVNWHEFQELGILGIDEIAVRKGHKDYVAVITSQQANGQVKLLAILEDRKKATVIAFLKTIPERLRNTIHTVCTDMWEGYTNAVKEALPDNVQLVIDRFHVARKYRQGVDALRKQELKRLKQELSKAEYKQLKGHLWAVRYNWANLPEKKKTILEKLFYYSPVLAQAHQLREQLTGIFDKARNPTQAIEQIQAWKQHVIDSGLDCFDKFLKMLDDWWEGIINYFHQRNSSGFVEGLNNKIKTLKRRCYGLFMPAHLFQRLYLDLEGYRLFSRV